MAKARPALLTVALSAAAALGYLTYRVIGDVPSRADLPMAQLDAEQAVGGEAPAITLVDRLPEFSLSNLDGEPQSIGSWPGKPLLINFWATWCAPCRREIPMLKEYQEGNHDVQVVGIAVDRDEPVARFAAEMQFNYPILVGQSDAWEAASAFGVNVFALPFTVFTASDGAVLGVHTGELHREHLENLDAVLADLASGAATLDDARARISGRM
jgi:thiol-disulfide isomerase/thioredoxin